jgi:acyl carrier protein
MENTEKIKLLEELLELDNNSLSVEKELSSIDEWDSVAILSLIVLLEDEFNKSVKGTAIKKCKTIGDILELMS